MHAVVVVLLAVVLPQSTSLKASLEPARRGVATEAVRQVADFAFGNTDLVRLEIVCAVGNDASQRVAERAGAVREGVLRHRLLLHGQPVDAVMYSVVRRE